MTADEGLDALDAERRHLLALAFRMLGTTADAEDAVQETYLRWYRMSPPEQAAIENPAAWLTRVASRVCLDLLGSARARREQYVGEWLPEPVPAALFVAIPRGADPLDRVTLDDSVSTALLVVLESMTPAERVAFVLHDVFAMPFPEIAEVVGRSPAAVRQLATSARRRVRDGRVQPIARDEHDAVVRAFAEACQRGDIDALTRLLDPDVTMRSDGGGVVRAALRPVRGVDNVARFVLGVLAKQSDIEVREAVTGDGIAFAMHTGVGIHSVANLRVVDGRVVDVWLVMNPHKLTTWV